MRSVRAGPGGRREAGAGQLGVTGAAPPLGIGHLLEVETD